MIYPRAASDAEKKCQNEIAHALFRDTKPDKAMTYGVHISPGNENAEALPLSCPQPRREILAIIPARGGSKGIPGKNIVSLCGKPLIAYSIEAALHSGLVTRVVVSTDDEAIAEEAMRWGADVPFLRPRELSSDTSSLKDVVGHALGELKRRSYHPEGHVILLPTSPFRNPRLINFAVDKLLQGYRQVITVRPVAFDSRSYFQYTPGEPLRMFFPQSNNSDSVAACKQYGVLHAISNRGDDSFGIYVISLRQASDMPYLIDIDTPEDLRGAESMIRRKVFDFELQ